MPKQSSTTKSTSEGRVEKATEGMVAFPGAESPSSFSDIPVYGAPARIGRFTSFVEETGGGGREPSLANASHGDWSDSDTLPSGREAQRCLHFM